MKGRAPTGPLLGDELERATELLTPKQLIAFRYRRDGHALNWIARRMNISRPRVVHLVAAAEKRLGYVQTVTPKKKMPYKPVVQQRKETEAAWQAYFEELTAQLQPEELDRITEIFETSKSKEELERRLAERLRVLADERSDRERAYLSGEAEHADDWSSAVGEFEAEFAAQMEADFGLNPVTGEVMRPEDLVEDDGKGYDRL